MTDTVNGPNQPQVGNPSGEGEPSVPAWIDAGVQSSGSPKTKPPATSTAATMTPDDKLISQKPQVYQPTGNGKSKKIVNFISMVFLVLVLSSLTFGGLFFLDKKAKSKLEQEKASSLLSSPPAQHIVEKPLPLPAEPTFTKKGDFALSVNRQILSWEEYEDFLNYKLKRMRENVNDEQVRENLNNYLIEGFLLTDTARKRGISLTSEDLVQAGTDLFGSAVDQELGSYPQAQRLIETYAYKKKIKENLVSWKTGGSMVVEIGGPRATAVAGKKGMDAKELAQQLIQPYYQQAQAGASVKDLMIQAETDQELIAFNGGPQSDFVERYIKDDPRKTIGWEDPHYYEVFFSLNAGETSDLFILKHPNNLETNSWIDYGYVFIRIDEAFKGQFDTYKNWLDSVTQGAEIISNL